MQYSSRTTRGAGRAIDSPRVHIYWLRLIDSRRFPSDATEPGPWPTARPRSTAVLAPAPTTARTPQPDEPPATPSSAAVSPTQSPPNLCEALDRHDRMFDEDSSEVGLGGGRTGEGPDGDARLPGVANGADGPPALTAVVADEAEVAAVGIGHDSASNPGQASTGGVVECPEGDEHSGGLACEVRMGDRGLKEQRWFLALLFGPGKVGSVVDGRHPQQRVLRGGEHPNRPVWGRDLVSESICRVFPAPPPSEALVTHPA